MPGVASREERAKVLRMTTLRLDIWSDLACPWCYVGKRRLESALAKFEHAGDVEIVWRSYELDASAPRFIEGDHVERLAKKYRMTEDRARATIQRLVDTAAEEGITMRFDKIRSGNTFDGHRLLHLAGERGLQNQLKERLVRGYFCEGEALGDPAALTRLAVEVGLDETEVKDVLASDRYAAEVRADEALARELQITGVPFFVLARGEVAVAGAQPSDEMLISLREAWAAITAPLAEGEGSDSAVAAGAVDGAACSTDGHSRDC
jgi:predicted DsbA family dithiol-disulfide isomerase